MKALLGVVKFEPKDMAKFALKFERKYRSRAGEKTDPDHYVSTEVKYLSALQSNCLTHLLVLFITSAFAWLLLDQLETLRQKMENENKTFIDNATFKNHETAIDLSKLQQDLAHSADYSRDGAGFKPQIEELEKLNTELKKAIDDFQKDSKDQLNMKHFLKNLHKINDYKNLEEFFKNSNENLNKKGMAIAELMETISAKRDSLRTAYQHWHYERKAIAALDRCQQDLSALEEHKMHLKPEKQHKLNFFQRQYDKLKNIESTKLTESTVEEINNLSKHIHLWGEKEISKYHQAKMEPVD